MKIGVKQPAQILQTRIAWLSPLRKAVEGWIVKFNKNEASEEVRVLIVGLIIGTRKIANVEDCD